MEKNDISQIINSIKKDKMPKAVCSDILKLFLSPVCVCVCVCVCACVCVFEVRDMLTVKVYGGDIGCFLFWIVCVHEFHTDPYKFSD